MSLLDARALPLSPLQIRSVVESDARINIWTGAIRSGKTIASLLRWLMYVANAPYGGHLVLVGKTSDTIHRNVLGPLQDPALFGPLAAMTTHTRGANVATILGRKVEVIGANNANAVARLRGMTCAGVYCDELTLLPEGFFTELLGRLSVAGAQLFGTTNPDNPGHWLRKKYLLRAEHLGLRTWHFTLGDNPALDQAYVAALKREFGGLWYRRFILGEWCMAEGAVYDMWDPDRHVVKVDRLPWMRRWIAVGVDYGTRNASAALLLGLGEDGRLYLTDEWRHDSRQTLHQLTDGEQSAALQRWLREIRRPREQVGSVGVTPEWVYVDPAAASFKLQLWRDGLANVADADNDVLNGIRTVATLLGRDQLRVSERCTGFLQEIPGYSWDEKAALRGEDKPIKADDHSLDGGRYAIASTAWAWQGLLDEGLEAA